MSTKTKHRSRGHGPKSQGSSSKSASSPSAPTSFLFISNELPTNDKPEELGSMEARYVDGRWRPPRDIRGFKPQQPGWVYRWTDGVVSSASDYAWNQYDTIANTANGRIWNTCTQDVPEYYRAATVFYCNRFDLFFTSRVDASMRNLATADLEDDWHPLTFSHSHNISRLEHAGAQPHLDVHAAPWIDQLLPNSYRRQSSSHDHAHRGLAGVLPIAVSLVAFSCANRNDLHEALIGDYAWYGGEWRGHRRPSGCVPERGFVTTIYLDPENPEGSTADILFDLEYGRTPIFR
ncbi:hypothetical protein HYALB_00004848 [Hymenoscyphus albidus]|uniref:Uncharacterized protein n=1 Tax=Hymenoscyphus albidus TaxID=595503 RepID=A0A9N9M0W6_9HELO|nr:hypothetical protein HYALB_00004848 [Hymenoscyphus albidus]